MFFSFLIGGNYVVDEVSMRVHVQQGGPAALAGVVEGDRILSVNGEAVKDWDQLKKQIGAHAGDKIDLEVEREVKGAAATRIHCFATPVTDGEHRGKILVGPDGHVQPVTVGQAALLSVQRPPMVVYELVRGLARMVTFKDKPQLSGPVGIVREVGNAAKDGVHPYLMLLGALSAYLGGFNLLPFPALDGGRLLFLGFEAASRRKADAKIEAGVHFIGLLMFLTLIAVVTYTEVIPSRKTATEETAKPASK
jgi:regulator of sigma E protease